MIKHSNISMFVPNLGCPCRCSFCDQNRIACTDELPDKAKIDAAVSTALNSGHFDSQSGQLAFFGGSFTAIDRNYMISLLEAGYQHVLAGRVCGIRISTRPDCIDDEILSLLKRYGVTSIELGAQSMCDEVLIANNRGHLSQAVYDASEKIRSFGFELGLQMMTGLYKSSAERDIYTAERFVEIHPDTVRIYPTVVLENTALCALYRRQEYTPQTVDEAAALGARLLKLFDDAEITVIRFGLHEIDLSAYVAGPWHPALKELAQALMFREKAEQQLIKLPHGSYILSVNPTDVSRMTGQKRTNITYFQKMGYDVRVKADNEAAQGDVCCSQD